MDCVKLLPRLGKRAELHQSRPACYILTAMKRNFYQLLSKPMLSRVKIRYTAVLFYESTELAIIDARRQ